MNTLVKLITDSINALAEMQRSYTLLAVMAPSAAKDFVSAMRLLEISIVAAKEFQIRNYDVLKTLK